MPLEATLLALFVLYNIVLLGWRGATLGKSVCGLEVRTSKGGAIAYARASLRETIGKSFPGGGQTDGRRQRAPGRG